MLLNVFNAFVNYYLVPLCIASIARLQVEMFGSDEIVNIGVVFAVKDNFQFVASYLFDFCRFRTNEKCLWANGKPVTIPWCVIRSVALHCDLIAVLMEFVNQWHTILQRGFTASYNHKVTIERKPTYFIRDFLDRHFLVLGKISIAEWAL